jgi:hypothetical protein
MSVSTFASDFDDDVVVEPIGHLEQQSAPLKTKEKRYYNHPKWSAFFQIVTLASGAHQISMRVE